MRSARADLTPHMLEYAEKFDDRGEIAWHPHLVHFHPAAHRSAVVNTDRLGFRLAHGPDAVASAGGSLPPGPVRVLAGSSTVFGIGASGDAATLPSRLWSQHAPGAPWLNFGGRSFNSTQELLLFVLHRHLLPQVEEIVLFSGFNDLGLSRLPASLRGEHGAFFLCGSYLQRTGQAEAPGRFRRRAPAPAEDVPSTEQQMQLAAELTLRRLDTWRALAAATGARLTFVLQPLAGWVRDEPAPPERRLFEELDRMADFSGTYGEITGMAAGRRYAEVLGAGCARLGVRFLDFAPVLRAAAKPADWLFVDRIHFTDLGHDLAARLLAEQLA